MLDKNYSRCDYHLEVDFNKISDLHTKKSGNFISFTSFNRYINQVGCGVHENI